MSNFMTGKGTRRPMPKTKEVKVLSAWFTDCLHGNLHRRYVYLEASDGIIPDHIQEYDVFAEE